MVTRCRARAGAGTAYGLRPLVGLVSCVSWPPHCTGGPATTSLRGLTAVLFGSAMVGRNRSGRLRLECHTAISLLITARLCPAAPDARPNAARSDSRRYAGGPRGSLGG